MHHHNAQLQEITRAFLYRLSSEQDMHKFTPVGPKSVAKSLVAVICNHLSNIPYIFRHCDLLVPNKILEKKLQEKIIYRISH